MAAQSIEVRACMSHYITLLYGCNYLSTSLIMLVWLSLLLDWCKINPMSLMSILYQPHIDWLVQERHNSIAKALELRLSYTNSWIYCYRGYTQPWPSVSSPILDSCTSHRLAVCLWRYNTTSSFRFTCTNIEKKVKFLQDSVDYFYLIN